MKTFALPLPRRTIFGNRQHSGSGFLWRADSSRQQREANTKRRARKSFMGQYGKICLEMDYHPVTNQLTDLLTSQNIPFETFAHEPVRTSEQAARTRPGYALKQGAKAILARIKKSESEKFFVMLVFPADKQFDKRKVKTYFHARDIRFATESEVAALTNGVEPGGVPPFGNLFGLRVIADPTLFDNENIVFNAGDRRFSISMRAQDYKLLVNPEIANLIGTTDD